MGFSILGCILAFPPLRRFTGGSAAENRPPLVKSTIGKTPLAPPTVIGGPAAVFTEAIVDCATGGLGDIQPKQAPIGDWGTLKKTVVCPSCGATKRLEFVGGDYGKLEFIRQNHHEGADYGVPI